MKYKKDINHPASEGNTYFKEVSAPLAIDLSHLFEGYAEFVFSNDFSPGVRFSADINLQNNIITISGDVIHKVKYGESYLVRVKVDYIPEVFLKEIEHMMTTTNHVIN